MKTYHHISLKEIIFKALSIHKYKFKKSLLVLLLTIIKVIFSVELIICGVTQSAWAIRDPFLSMHQSNNSPHYVTKMITLHYVDISEILALLRDQHNGLLSTEGHVVADTRTRKLWITDLATNVNNVQRWLTHLDVPLPQVVINAQIVSVDDSVIKELGVIATSSSKDKDKDSPSPPAIEQGHFVLAVTRQEIGLLLRLQIMALVNSGHAKLISSPQLLAEDNQWAYIASGEEVPYQEKTKYGDTSTTFRKAVLSLKVKSQVLSANRIHLHLEVNQDKISPMIVNGVPIISTRQILTDVTMENGATLVLSGIYEQSHNGSWQRVPWLSHLPVLGILFRNQQTHTDRKQLLILVTPKIASGKST